ncbi:MAG: prepilin-type N-terminal cleavage/methylation domain-containing protein [Helicobacteraceae bacterium]|nr:prepilin-type N-terminal cleavage/methylation domain-containing protein [Helicobacteraceae bacterium]
MQSKEGFTLIEMVISVLLLSMITTFLYQTLSQFRLTTNSYKSSATKIDNREKIVKTLFLDIKLSEPSSLNILEDDKEFNAITLQSTHSLHRRYNPYITYAVNKNVLYRIESLEAITVPIIQDLKKSVSIDSLGKVSNFKIYKSTKASSFLIDYRAKKSDITLFKINMN